MLHLKGSVYYYIKSMLKTSVTAGIFYNDVIEYVEDIVVSLKTISSNTSVHVFNNHKPFKKIQLEELESIQEEMVIILDQLASCLEQKKIWGATSYCSSKRAVRTRN